jgi:hypothetical protein
LYKLQLKQFLEEKSFVLVKKNCIFVYFFFEADYPAKIHSVLLSISSTFYAQIIQKQIEQLFSSYILTLAKGFQQKSTFV